MSVEERIKESKELFYGPNDVQVYEQLYISQHGEVTIKEVYLEVTIEEKRALKLLKKKEISGQDGLQDELLKYGGGKLIRTLTSLTHNSRSHCGILQMKNP